MKLRAGTLLLLLLPTTAWTYDLLEDENITDNGQTESVWREDKVEIPANFNAQDLQAFSMNHKDNHFSYYIERASLKTGDDFVTRYVLVIRSSQGTTNSSYEGMRCGHRQFKVYAYGGAGKLTPLSSSDWQSVPKGAGADYRTRLYDDLICNLQTGLPNPAEEVFNAMGENHDADTTFLGFGQ